MVREFVPHPSFDDCFKVQNDPPSFSSNDILIISGIVVVAIVALLVTKSLGQDIDKFKRKSPDVRLE